jgi:hypothetical protein
VDRGRVPDRRFDESYLASVASAADAIGFPLASLRSALNREAVA